MRKILLGTVMAVVAAGATPALSQDGAADRDPPPASNGPTKHIDTATLRNFIKPDPLRGDNGRIPSPATVPGYGAINLGLDVDGNAIEATNVADIAYFDGRYYLYGASSACGEFSYALGGGETTPRSFNRTCGLTIYSSTDLMNWRFVSRVLAQDPRSGAIASPGKARVVYSPSTKLYNMWISAGHKGFIIPHVMQSSTPYGPWSAPKPVKDALGLIAGTHVIDTDLGTDENGETWLVSSHGKIRVFKLSDDKTDIVEKAEVPVPIEILNGGIGIHFEKGWWYVTGGPSCANCVATAFSYVMAKSPRGPWISPASGKASAIAQPEVVSEDSGNAQTNGSSQLPDGKGGFRTLMPLKHFIATAAKAPTDEKEQPGDVNLALMGLWYYPLSYDASGRIKPMKVTPESSFPLADKVHSPGPPPAYQADLSVSATRSIEQTWTIDRETVVASILPAVFQRTIDDRPREFFKGPFISFEQVAKFKKDNNVVLRPLDPLVDAPLIATLELPDGTTQSWTIDPRTVSWSPRTLPLNLTKPYRGGGTFRLRLETRAANGSYGVAVGPALPGGSFAHIEKGARKLFPVGMALRSSDVAIPAPTITMQPRSVRVEEGQEAGFLVQAEGRGVGYQWLRNGKIILDPNGKNSSTGMAFEIKRVTAQDAGTYQAIVLNQSGSVSSAEVTLEVTPKASPGLSHQR